MLSISFRWGRLPKRCTRRGDSTEGIGEEKIWAEIPMTQEIGMEANTAAICRFAYLCTKSLSMTLQLEIDNPQDAELILTLVRRLNIPFKQATKKATPKTEREKAIERLKNFKATEPSSFGDALDNEADFPRIDMASAASLLAKDYAHDEELTAFSILDSEDFYEQR